MSFSLEGFLKKKRKIIITQWVDQLKTQVSPQYADRPEQGKRYCAYARSPG